MILPYSMGALSWFVKRNVRGKREPDRRFVSRRTRALVLAPDRIVRTGMLDEVRADYMNTLSAVRRIDHPQRPKRREKCEGTQRGCERRRATHPRDQSKQ